MNRVLQLSEGKLEDVTERPSTLSDLIDRHA